MNDQVQQLLFQILTISISVLTPVIIGAIVALLKQQLTIMKSRISNESWFMLIQFAGEVVRAAEQSGLSGQIEAVGAAKKEWAVAELQRVANEHGLGWVDMKTLSLVIEAAVKDTFPKQQPKPVIVSNTFEHKAAEVPPDLASIKS